MRKGGENGNEVDETVHFAETECFDPKYTTMASHGFKVGQDFVHSITERISFRKHAIWPGVWQSGKTGLVPPKSLATPFRILSILSKNKLQYKLTPFGVSMSMQQMFASWCFHHHRSYTSQKAAHIPLLGGLNCWPAAKIERGSLSRQIVRRIGDPKRFPGSSDRLSGSKFGQEAPEPKEEEEAQASASAWMGSAQKTWWVWGLGGWGVGGLGNLSLLEVGVW